MQSFAPAAAMVYTDLETLRGLVKPVDYGSGIEYADGILNSLFPSSDVGLQIGLWLNGTYGCEAIINNRMNNELEELRNYLQFTNATAVFLRVGYEFDNPFFGYSDNPATYIAAFQKIVKYLKNGLSPEKLEKTQFVWHSWAAPRQGNLTLEDFYPGSEFVDWIGISLFRQVFPWKSDWGNGYVDWGGSMVDVEEVLLFAEQHDKPTMIAESTPFGGINLNTTDTVAYGENDPWDRWFGKVIDLIERYDIDLFSYINCNWESQPMWHNVGFGDTRLSSNKEVLSKWHDLVINGKGSQRFLMAGTLNECAKPEVTAKKSRFADTEVGFVALLACLFVASVMLIKMCTASNHRRHQATASEQTPLVNV